MKIKIYGKEGCVFCERAINHSADLIKEKKVTSFEYIDTVKAGIDKVQLAELVNVAKVETLPQIQVLEDDQVAWKYVGGFTELYIKYPTE